MTKLNISLKHHCQPICIQNPNFSQLSCLDPSNGNSNIINPSNPVNNLYISLLNAYDNPHWLDPDTHMPNLNKSAP